MSTLIVSPELNRSEYEIQVSTARMYPRDIGDFMKRAIILATTDEEIAQSCIYALPPRKDKDGKTVQIKGPSIRLAEIAAACYGHIYAGSRIVSIDDRNIIARGFIWDMQMNNRFEKDVIKSILKKNGETYSADMQTMAAAAACAIAYRNAVFTAMTKAIINPIYDAARKFAIGTQEMLPTKVKKFFDYFSKFGITADKITTFYGKQREDFTLEDVESLIGLATAVKDNMITIDKVFVIEADDECSMTPAQKISAAIELSKRQNAQASQDGIKQY